MWVTHICLFQGSRGTNITIDTVCGIMGDSSYGDNIMRYAAINSLMLDTYEEKCLDIGYNEMISNLKEVSWDSPSDWGRSQSTEHNNFWLGCRSPLYTMVWWWKGQ